MGQRKLSISLFLAAVVFATQTSAETTGTGGMEGGGGSGMPPIYTVPIAAAIAAMGPAPTPAPANPPPTSLPPISPTGCGALPSQTEIVSNGDIDIGHFELPRMGLPSKLWDPQWNWDLLGAWMVTGIRAERTIGATRLNNAGLHGTAAVRAVFECFEGSWRLIEIDGTASAKSTPNADEHATKHLHFFYDRHGNIKSFDQEKNSQAKVGDEFSSYAFRSARTFVGVKSYGFEATSNIGPGFEGTSDLFSGQRWDLDANVATLTRSSNLPNYTSIHIGIGPEAPLRHVEVKWTDDNAVEFISVDGVKADGPGGPVFEALLSEFQPLYQAAQSLEPTFMMGAGVYRPVYSPMMPPADPMMPPADPMMPPADPLVP